MKGISICLICFLFFSCKRERADFKNIAIIGHGGNGLENIASIFHDNSMEAVELVLNRSGVQGVELDIQMAQDGSLWCYHDTQLNTETNGEGCIADRTANYLNSLTYRTLNKERLLCLNDIPEILLRNKLIFLDLRHRNECSQSVIDLEIMLESLEAFRQKNSQATIHVVTMNENWVNRLQLKGFLVYFETQPTNPLVDQVANDVQGFVFKNQLSSKGQVSKIQALGKKVVLFEMRSPKGVNGALNKFPDGVMTDDIRVALIEKN